MKKLMFLLFKKVTNVLSGMDLWGIPGVAPLWRFIYKTVSPKGEILITCQGNKMYVNAELGYGDLGPILLIKGIYEKHETELFKKLIKPGMIVVDVGANIGYYALVASKLIGN